MDGWWKMVNSEADKLSKKRRLQQAGQARKIFEDRILPNQALVGWRGWWSRMRPEPLKDK